jgi:selenide,water dikinase
MATIACTGSRAAAWLAASGLPSGDRGRVCTEPSLQVVGQPRLFASGDCAVIAADPRPPSGVWAVRAAPVLAANLQRALAGQPLQRWRPQRRALQLLGDGGVSGSPRAIALWGPLALGPSRWLWRWKDQIDRRFMTRFTALSAAMTTQGAAGAGAAMACRGCAAKVGAGPLEAALQQLEGPGLVRDDAAVVGTAADGRLLLQSVDGFPALVSDPWLNGRLTTLHACSDLWACGARLDSAQAVVTLPAIAAPLQSELLHQTLAGVRSVLDPLEAPLLGGHTLEARDTNPGKGLSLMLTVNGSAPAGQLWPKGPLHPGDALILMRPIGTGVLFAAAMAGAARPHWIDQALVVMQQSQAPLVALLAAHGCQACTDITGFGLLGHLGEMVTASPSGTVSVKLDGSALGRLALPGALELLAAGHASTLAPANARALALLDGPITLAPPAGAALQQLLIDPQTCGPLLAALPAARATAALAALHRAGFAQAAVVGQVV